MRSFIKNCRNAGWFKSHPYAYYTLFKRRLNQARNRPFLYNAELCFDVGCNYRCKHCSISIFQEQIAYSKSMTLDEVARVADQLKAMDCFLCCIVGGEPTIRPDLPEIISTFHGRWILPTLITNGFSVDEKYMAKLKAAGLFSIGFSLNGFDARSHDAFVQIPGAFDRQLKAIDIAIASGIRVSIAVVPTHASIKSGEYRRLIEFARSKGVRVNVNYPALAGAFTGRFDQLLSKTELEEVRQYFKLSNVTSDFTVMGGKDGGAKYECPAGRKKVYILPDGSVTPCTFIHISFGNILTEPLQVIMERIWATKIFMSRPNLCLTGESEAFNRRFLGPVFSSKRLPLDFRDHPLFKDGKL